MQRLQLVPLEEDEDEWGKEIRRSKERLSKALSSKRDSKRERVKRHDRELVRYLTLRKKRRQERGDRFLIGLPEGDREEDNLDAAGTEVISQLQLHHQARARRVLEKLRGQKIVSWDAKGNVFIHGERLPRANLLRLMREAVVHQGLSRRKPGGWNRFVDALAESDILIPQAVDEWHPSSDPPTPPVLEQQDRDFPEITEQERREHGGNGMWRGLRQRRQEEDTAWKEWLEGEDD